MGVRKETTWTCDGCGTECYVAPVGWLETTFRRQTGDNRQSLYTMLLCVACQERALDALESQSKPIKEKSALH